ncbi:hypothetical protein D3C81_1013490 [compost metagenome]
MTHDRLQGLYQYGALFDGDDVLAGFGAETDFKLLGFVIPTHRHPGTAPITKFRSSQRSSPALRHHSGDPLQLFGQQALLECQLLSMGQVLQVAATTAGVMFARCRTTLWASAEDPFQACFDHFAVGIEHPCFDLFACQRATDKPGTPLNKGDTTPIPRQALNVQALFFAGRDLRCTAAAGRLKAQAAVAFTFGHQFAASKMPVDR